MKKYRIIFIIVFIVLLIGFVSIHVLNNHTSTGNKIISLHKTCDDIKSAQKNKDSFIVYINPSDPNQDSKEVLDGLKEKHDDLKVIRASNTLINQKCFQQMLQDVGLFESVKGLDDPVAILYNDGNYNGAFLGVNDYNTFEQYLREKGLLPKITENINLSSFKTNIQGKYVILLINVEDQRDMVSKHAKKAFKDIKYDIVNIESDDGSKIFKYVYSTYKIGSTFPQGLYFENSKLINQSEVFQTDSEYQTLLKK